MKAKDLAKLFLEHPDKEVYAYGIKGTVESHNVVFNGENYYIGA